MKKSDFLEDVAFEDIEEYGIGQGPNVVMSLGVTGTLRQKRIIGFPLPNKKQANKEMKRGGGDESCLHPV